MFQLNMSIEQLYNNIQVSVLGIALVLGFFLIWRILRRIEERISAIPACKCTSGELCFRPERPQSIPVPSQPQPKAQPKTLELSDEDMLDMDNYFGSLPTTVKVMMSSSSAPKQPQFVIEEEDMDVLLNSVPAPSPSPVSAPPPVVELPVTQEQEQEQEPEQEHEHESVYDDDSISISSISKSKLQKLSIETLRELCIQNDLSPDGTKKNLIERILHQEAKK